MIFRPPRRPYENLTDSLSGGTLGEPSVALHLPPGTDHEARIASTTNGTATDEKDCFIHACKDHDEANQSRNEAKEDDHGFLLELVREPSLDISKTENHLGQLGFGMWSVVSYRRGLAVCDDIPE